MATTAHVIWQASVEGLQAESVPLVRQWVLTTPTLRRDVHAWGAGDLTLTVPAGATFLVFDPPATTTAGFKLKGNAGDTGWSIPATIPSIIPVHLIPAGAFLINASGAVTDVAITFL